MMHLHLILLALLLPFWFLVEILHLREVCGVSEDDEPQLGGVDAHEYELEHGGRG